MRTIVFLLLVATISPAAAKALRILPWDEGIAARKMAIVSGEKRFDVGYLHPDKRSEPIRIPSESQSLRLETPDRIDDEGKPHFVPIVIPASIKTPLLLILPDKRSGTGLQVKVMEDASDSFSWGTFRIINITSKTIGFRWENNAKRIPTGWNPVDVSPKGRKRNMEVALYAKESEDATKPFYRAVWEHRPDMRQLVFLVPGTDKSLGPVACKFVPERRITQPANP